MVAAGRQTSRPFGASTTMAHGKKKTSRLFEARRMVACGKRTTNRALAAVAVVILALVPSIEALANTQPCVRISSTALFSSCESGAKRMSFAFSLEAATGATLDTVETRTSTSRAKGVTDLAARRAGEFPAPCQATGAFLSVGFAAPIISVAYQTSEKRYGANMATLYVETLESNPVEFVVVLDTTGIAMGTNVVTYLSYSDEQENDPDASGVVAFAPELECGGHVTVYNAAEVARKLQEGDESDCDVCSGLSIAQVEALAMYDDGGKQIICDPTCLDSSYDPTHCNYFGLGQICRGCGDCSDCIACPVTPAPAAGLTEAPVSAPTPTDNTPSPTSAPVVASTPSPITTVTPHLTEAPASSPTPIETPFSTSAPVPVSAPSPTATTTPDLTEAPATLTTTPHTPSPTSTSTLAPIFVSTPSPTMTTAPDTTEAPVSVPSPSSTSAPVMVSTLAPTTNITPEPTEVPVGAVDNPRATQAPVMAGTPTPNTTTTPDHTEAPVTFLTPANTPPPTSTPAPAMDETLEPTMTTAQEPTGAPISMPAPSPTPPSPSPTFAPVLASTALPTVAVTPDVTDTPVSTPTPVETPSLTPAPVMAGTPTPITTTTPGLTATPIGMPTLTTTPPSAPDGHAASTPSPATIVTSADDDSDGGIDCSVCVNVSAAQVEALATYDNGGKQIVCDPACVDGVSDPTHCNYFGLGQICRGCGDCSTCTPCP